MPIALLAHGFRPFFLLSGIWAALTITLWVAALHGAPLPPGPLPIVHWHAHEMIAGFIGAAISGFLLTAVPNWTGRRGYGGAPLALLVALFVAGRLVLLPGSPVPVGIAAVVALLPLPALLLIVLPALLRARTPRLFGPPAIVLGFWAADLLMLGGEAGWWDLDFDIGALLALNVALMLVGLIGGRIVPSFTVNALRKAGRPAELRPLPGVDRAAVVSLLGVAIVDLLWPEGVLSGLVSGVAAALLALRLSRWHGLRTLDQPIVWILHLGYALAPLALAVKAVALLTGADWAAGWMHLQGAGAIAVMILAVMTRATLGHTGRALEVGRATTLAYLLLPLAALTRAFGPALLPSTVAYGLAGGFWVAAFGLFLAVYGPMLLRPRADGKPG
ncbi:MAG TPA: NnrS family protein [Acetobacteraceae bacterium]|nr:NnrS family protein [Acetobacteraceae bacterium]